MQEEAPSVSGEVIDSVPDGGEPMVPRAGRIGGFTLGLLCLLAFLPGFFGLPPTDREGRFAQASRQVYEAAALAPVQRGPGRDAVVPHFQSEARAGQGPLGHWVQAASAAFFSGGNPHKDAIWMYRVPSFIAAIVIVLMTRRLGEAMFDRSAGRLAAWFLIVCPLVAWEARQADASMMTAAWVLGAVSILWRAFSEPDVPIGFSRAILFWVCVAGACLSSGLVALVTLVVAVVSVCILSRRGGWLLGLYPLFGFPLAALLVGAWVYAAASRIGGPALLSSVVQVLVWGDAPGWWPPGLHTVLLPILIWPASMLLPLGFAVAWRLGVPGRGASVHPSYLFLVAWVVPAWIVLEALPGQGASSVLGLYPALSILGARAILAAGAAALPGLDSRLARSVKVAWLVIGAGLVFASLGLITLRLVVWPGSTIGALGATAAAFLAGLIMLKALRASRQSLGRGLHANAAFAGAGAMFLIWFTVPTIALPRVLGLSSAANDELTRIDPSGSRPVAAVGYRSASLVYLTRGRVALLDPEAAGTWLAGNPEGLLVRSEGLSVTVSGNRELASVSGLDTSRWRVVRLAIEERQP